MNKANCDSTRVSNELGAGFPNKAKGAIYCVARGCGWQHVAAYMNFVAFYLVGMTIAALLAFTFKPYVKGLWIGLICGLFCQAATLLFMTLRTKWIKLQSTENCEKVDPVLARNE
ncbi:hypothetical protein TIFTF001_050851 [Ficus carica]|uniref:Uncharacterized protein n=1 Tax=Ficus carica TaxID=3494 RepID=A0AA87YVI0_FICCA|nr:hypothetical protein TIFTF001_050851 [Ficus carica]